MSECIGVYVGGVGWKTDKQTVTFGVLQMELIMCIVYSCIVFVELIMFIMYSYIVCRYIVCMYLVCTCRVCTCKVCTCRVCTSAPLSEVTNLTKELNACTDDIKTWMTENQLKMNDDKTEALLFPFSSSLKASAVSLPHSIILGSHNIAFYDSAGTLDSFLTQNCP